MKAACLHCAAAWAFLLGMALDFAGAGRLLGGEPWAVPAALLLAGTVVWAAACSLIVRLVLEEDA